MKRFRLILCLALLFVLMAGGVVAAKLRSNLNQDWAAMKGILRINHGMPEWYFDREDPEQSRTVARLQRVYRLTDAKGSLLQVSDVYAMLDDDGEAKSKSNWRIRRDARGAHYLIRSGVLYSNDRDPYFVAIGRPLGRW